MPSSPSRDALPHPAPAPHHAALPCPAPHRAALPLLRAMRPLLLTALAALSLAGCDDKKPEPAPAPSATATATAAASAPEPARPAASAAPKPKKEVVCPKGTTVEFHDAALETEVRRKLSKPTGPISQADLKGVRTLNISGGRVNELDPCIFPHFTALKDLFLGPGELHDLSPLATLANLESLRTDRKSVV